MSQIDPLIIPMIFIFLSCREMAHDKKNSVVKFQNLVVNHESETIMIIFQVSLNFAPAKEILKIRFQI